VGETVFTGRSLSTIIRRDNYRDLALRTTDWLSDLAGRPKPRPRAVWWDRLVEPALAGLEARYAMVDRRMLQDTRERVGTLGGLPLICEHRDFLAWNLLVTRDGELAVVDWETAIPRGLPAVDLIYFLTFLALELDHEWNREAYRATLDSSTFTGGVTSECLERYASRIGLDRAAIGPLRLLLWAYHAGLADPHQGLCFSLWEEELGRGRK